MFVTYEKGDSYEKMLGIFVGVAISAAAFTGCEFLPKRQVELYSLDGETMVVSVEEAEKYKNSKEWYTEPVQMLYSEDEQKVFKKSEVEKKA